MDFTKLQKPKYLESEISFSRQIKKFIKGYFTPKNSFVAEVIFRLYHFKVQNSLPSHPSELLRKAFFFKKKKDLSYFRGKGEGGVPHVD